MTNRVPLEGSEWIFMVPPRYSMAWAMTFMPIPLPASWVVSFADEKSGRQIMFRSFSFEREFISSGDMPIFSSRYALMASRSSPRPSSWTVSMSWSPCLSAFRTIFPSRSLPAFSRSSGGSIPWATAFRSRCINGSLRRSIKPISTSISPPTTSSFTSRL